MMSSRAVAVVTGSNEGIGFAIVKGLCEKLDGDIYLTAKDTGSGQAAVQILRNQGYNPLFHQLDITDQGSVDNFKDYIMTKHGGIDILINNAGIAFKTDATEPFDLQAKETIRVNYYGTLRVCQSLFPLLHENARVVNVSSLSGHLTMIPSDDLRAKLKNENLDILALNDLMDTFVRDSERGENEEGGWGSSAYNVSKVGVSALTFIQQRLFDEEMPYRNVAVNCVHTGHIVTDMTSHKGVLTIEEGAIAPLFLALEAKFKGKYVWRDCTIVDWDGTLPGPY